MREIAHTFRGIERPNVGPDTSLQPFDCALRSFAQESLQRMKNHLNWIEIWRIRRQVAQCCAASLDCLLYAEGFVERDVVDHHHIPAFERGNQTLFDISKEGLSVHGSLDNHGRNDPGLTEASNERHCFPMCHRNTADPKRSLCSASAQIARRCESAEAT